jgi:hypothetical protein
VRSKIPPEAFEVWVGMGPGRTYDAVARRYGVSKTALANCAKRENWMQRLAKVEREAQLRAEQRVIESIDAMNERHLKVVQVIQGKALETLKNSPIDSAMDAVRALDLAIRHERLIRGEPSERTAVTTESVLKGQFERWMTEESETSEAESPEVEREVGTESESSGTEELPEGSEDIP